jgi:hypothetical protein
MVREMYVLDNISHCAFHSDRKLVLVYGGEKDV